MRFDWLLKQSDQILQLLIWHLYLSIFPVMVGVVLAIPLGRLIQNLPTIKSMILNVFGLLYTIPSLALFVLLPAALGTRVLDVMNVIVALTIYSLALLVRTVCDGLDSISSETRQAAVAIGYHPLQQFIFIELPIALPVVTAGLRVVVVSNVSMVSIAALIGMPQLGSLFTQGFQLNFLTPIIAGIVLCISLALILDALLVFITGRLTSWKPRRTAS